MAERVTTPPWPDTCFVLDLDALVPEVPTGDLLGLERREQPVIGVVRRRCEGLALAAACCVQLLVAGPDATFRATGPSADLVTRRVQGLVGRRVASYLSVASVTAQDAHTWGLVSRIAPDPDEIAEELRVLIASRSPTAVAAILAQLARDATREHTRSRVTARVLDRSLIRKSPH